MLKRSPSPKIPERSAETGNSNEPKIVLKLGMIPQASKQQKEVGIVLGILLKLIDLNHNCHGLLQCSLTCLYFDKF